VGEKARERTSQGANEPGGEQAKRQISQAQGANKPGGKRARGQTSQGRTGKGAKKPDTRVSWKNRPMAKIVHVLSSTILYIGQQILFMLP